jgi:hypothetical protein
VLLTVRQEDWVESAGRRAMAEESWKREPRGGERATPRRCPRLMNMHEPPPSLRDVTGRPGVSAGAAPGPRQ